MQYPKSKTIFHLILFIIYINFLYYIQNIIPDTYQMVRENKIKVQLVNNTNLNIKIDVEEVINVTRNLIKWEVRHYNWDAYGVKRLEDLLPENGGKPLKILIISPWRSGSTFLGQLLASLPGVLYYYEPLCHFNDPSTEENLRNDKETSKNLLKNLLKCRYFNTSYSVKNAKDDFKPWQYYYYDNRIWLYCKESQELCEDASFRETFCKLFPFQIAKDVHVRLPFIEDLMEDKEVLRFEDLAVNPRGTVQSLLRFLSFHMPGAADRFLNAQSALSDHDGWLSKYDAFDWKNHMDFRMTEGIQDIHECKEAMDLWGYVPAFNWSHQHSDSFLPFSADDWW